MIIVAMETPLKIKKKKKCFHKQFYEYDRK